MLVPNPNWKHDPAESERLARLAEARRSSASWHWLVAIVVVMAAVVVVLTFLPPYVAAAGLGDWGVALTAFALAGSLLAVGLCVVRLGGFRM